MQKNLLLNVKDIRALLGSYHHGFEGVIQICEADLQFDLYFRFRSMSFICSPAEAGGV